MKYRAGGDNTYELVFFHFSGQNFANNRGIIKSLGILYGFGLVGKADDFSYKLIECHKPSNGQMLSNLGFL